MSEKKFEAWIKETYEPETLREIVEHGALCGFPGITYYHETVALYNEHEEEIWDALYEEAEAGGFVNVPVFIGSFNGAEHANTPDQFKNLLVWWYVEKTALAATEEPE